MRVSLLVFFLSVFSTVAFAQCLSVSYSTEDVSCFNGNDGEITVNVDAGVAPFTYELLLFRPGSGSSIIGTTTQAGTSVTFKTGNATLLPAFESTGIRAISNYPAGSEYRLNVSASGSSGNPFCEIVTVVGITISQPPALVLTIDDTDPDCDATVGSGNGSIDISVSGGTAPRTIQWTGPTAVANNTQVASNLDAGTYTILVTDAENCTVSQNIDIPIASTADAGGDQTICTDNTSLAANAPATGEIGSWSLVSGSGAITDPSSPTSTVTGLGFGDNVFQWLIQDAGMVCAGSSDQVTIRREISPTVDAGAPQAICEGTSASLSGTIGGTAVSATWSTAGDGSFDNASSLTATYTPGPADIAAGAVTLTLTTNDPAGPCVAANDNIVITIDDAATVDAGSDQAICAGGTATLAGAFGGIATAATWTTSGDGTFDDATSATATYTPGPADVLAKTVTLTFTTDDPVGACPVVADNVIITIDEAPTADAGSPQSVCEGSTVSLSGAITGAANATWTTAGDGSFDNASSLTAIYTPGTADVAAGTVTLTLTTEDPAGPCVAASANVVITIDKLATVDAGPDQAICAGGAVTLAGAFGGTATAATWTTSGDGTFDDVTSATATYTPGPADILAKTVTLTFTTDDPAGACPAVADNVVITIEEAPTADAGSPQSVCEGSTVSLSGAITGATNATWTTAGDGSFDDAATLTAIYTPGTADVAAGTVTLTLTTEDPAGPCVAASANVVITIDKLATVDAGSDQAICAGGTVTMAGAFGGTATAATWTTSGNGTFDDATSATATYTPGPADVLAKTVTLTFTTDDPAGACPAVADNVTITIDEAPTADAGSPQSVCEGSTVSLSGAITGAANATWTSAGDGSFDNASSLTAIYTPGTADVAAGTVTLTLTTEDPAGPCVAASANVVITIEDPAIVDAGPDQTICAGTTAPLVGAFGGTATGATWTTAGDGSFDNITSPNAIYTPGPADALAGAVTLTFTTDDPAGACLAVADNVIITIDEVPTADAGGPQLVCEGSTISLSGAITGATNATWSSAGDGTFDNASSLTAIYTPGTADIAAGTVTLTLTTEDPAGPCLAASANVVITFDDPAIVDAGPDQTICAGGTVTMAGTFGGTATGATWTSAGDGSFDDASALNAIYTPGTADVLAGTVTLTFTTDDPAGVCGPESEDVVITITAAATANAGVDQTICVGGSATLAGGFTGTTGITWSTSGTGTFDDASSVNAIYTPDPADIAAGTVTLTITTAGPCAAVNDAMTLTIDPAPTVDAGSPQTVCSSSAVVLSGGFGGSATGLLWTSSGNGTFNDNTDPDATYTPDAADIAAGTVTITATATGSCPGITDNVVITLNAAANVDAGPAQTICIGGSATLNATLSGSATSITWASSGDGAFDNTASLGAVYSPGVNDIANGTVTLTATTNNPAGPCPATTDNVVITIMAIPGDQTTAGNETWIGYVYDDTGSPGTPPANINFDNAKYRGFIESTDIDNMSGASTYDVVSDEFDMNLGLAIPVQGPNVCGSHLNYFSVRYKMNKTLPAGIYRFTVGGDDGVRLLVDGVDVLPAAAFSLHDYDPPYTSDPVCLTAGVHALEIQYFDNTAHSRLTFNYEVVPAVTTNSPANVCVNAAAPTLTASSADAAVTGFNWYKGGSLVFTGASFTPSATDLDMTAAGVTTFGVTAVYACGETQPSDVVVNVVNSAAVTVTPQTVCESAGPVDLRTLVSESPAGGTFVFSGHPNISGNNFDPTGLSGTTVSILVDYSIGTCTAPQETLSLTISNTATVTVPASAAACESASDIDLTTLVSASPSGGTFTFNGTQVTGTAFDPSGLSGLQTITVDYSVGGCVAATTTFDIDVTSTATLTTSNVNACETGSAVNLLTLVSAAPTGGTFTFTGPGVSGSLFDPAGQSGTVNIAVDYDLNGCADNGVIQVTVLAPTDPLCTAGNCADVVIVPMPEPATCTNSDGRLVMDINPFTPAVNNTGVKITIDGISTTGLQITRTIFNQNTFEALPVGAYTYTIEYGDPSCVKTGLFSIDQSGTVGTPEASDIISPVCAGSATGTLTLDVPGETGNILEWSLDGGLTDPFKPFTAGGQITGIPAGPAPSFQQVISVRRNISDVCYSSVTVTMPEGVQPISATFSVTPATCNGNDGAIAAIVPGGGNGDPYTFSIDGGQSFQSGADFTGLAGGSYTLRVKDAGGCEADFAANVTFPGFINSSITKNDADCTNNGSSGSISVSVSDPGVFEVAVTTDQFNAPALSEYQPYNNPSVTFASLPRGQYYVYVKSNGAACPTRSAPINVSGVYAIDFGIQPDCNNNELSIALVNVTGEAGGAPLEIQVSRVLSADPPEIIYHQFPADGEVYLAHDQYNFLKSPGEYRIRVIQFQNEVVCNLSSQTVDFTVPEPLDARVLSVAESYPDIPSGRIQVGGFSGGIYPYQVRIELDSASSFALPEYETGFEEAGLNQDQQVEMTYRRVPAGRYQVQVADELGCVVDLIARVPLDEDLFIPNVFTPNGDGSNDVFFIRNLPPAPTVNQLIISNRWGKEVFAAENYQNDWNGEGAADGLYFYRLQVAGGEAVTGWIEIMRGQKP